MTGSGIVSQRHGSVLEIRLARPQRRNALSRALLRQLRETVESLPAEMSAAVLTADGPVFSAGADFADLTGSPADLEYDRDLEAACAAVRRASVPTVAAVAGPCIGAGVELALSCDARVVGPKTFFRVPAVELGLLYNPDSIRRMHATLPRGTVTRMLVFAERLAGADAVAAGIATHSTESDVRAQALDIANSLAEFPRGAVKATRQLLHELDEGNHDESRWQRVREELLSSPDRRRAVDAARRRHA
ncbi:enoyl-CoA hydratase/isomerase family protein [Saccharomonospora viridis]|uniref:enoyl-CoA hydratase/isomerase family protein n=1 Tax=Saccharomonospora viridis TaxID=1852 RepID=UPI0024A86012|nr:enoyl-CoA hydratase/isomerase family protein [Saccharomonospora viridis]